jgi:hypothetical protein
MLCVGLGKPLGNYGGMWWDGDEYPRLDSDEILL